MKKMALVLLIMFTTASLAGDDTLSVDQGVQQDNWQMCMDRFANPCLTDCATSEDINCKDNCQALAKDQCTSKGLSPPTDTDLTN